MKLNLKPYITSSLILLNLIACGQLQQTEESSPDELEGSWQIPDEVKTWLSQAEANLAAGYKTFATGDYMARCTPETKDQCRHIYEWIQVKSFAARYLSAGERSETFLRWICN